jgi:hypothetical protein
LPYPKVIFTFAGVDSSAAMFTAIAWMASERISTGTAPLSGLTLYKTADPVSPQAMAAFLHRLAYLVP